MGLRPITVLGSLVDCSNPDVSQGRLSAGQVPCDGSGLNIFAELLVVHVLPGNCTPGFIAASCRTEQIWRELVNGLESLAGMRHGGKTTQ